jgi:hypothetical protein
MTRSPNLAKNRISGYLAPNALFTENRCNSVVIFEHLWQKNVLGYFHYLVTSDFTFIRAMIKESIGLPVENAIAPQVMTTWLKTKRTPNIGGNMNMPSKRSIIWRRETAGMLSA